jgi:hypothetical protein
MCSIGDSECSATAGVVSAHDWLKDRADVALFDPVFDDTDRVLLHDLGCKSLDTEQVRKDC